MSSTPEINSTDESVILSVHHLAKTFTSGHLQVHVFRDLSFTVTAGESLAITGASGSGKSTLLHLLGGLDKASAGSVCLMGRDYSTLNERELSFWRNRYLGFVYQFHHLLPEFSALENVAMPLLIRRCCRAEALERAEKVLKDVGLQARLAHRPNELSGGERQRAAIARALVSEPACILADEPTGNLDSQTAQGVFALLQEQCRAAHLALVIVTHDAHIAAQSARQLHLEALTANR